MVAVFLAEGFEETEAIAPVDILRRGGVETVFAAVGEKRVVGGHGIAVEADITLDEIDVDKLEMLGVPGGLGGVENMEASAKVGEIAKQAYAKGVKLAAICAGPRVLAKLDLLKGRKAVCYPGMENQMTGGDMQPGEKAVTDGALVTGQGPGAALDFGFALLAALRGDEAAEQVAVSMHYGNR